MARHPGEMGDMKVFAQATDLMQSLVRIESVNPVLVPTGAGEGPIAAFVAGWLDEHGLSVELQEVTPGRPNVIARTRSTSSRSLMLNAHLDTVGVTAMDDPFSGLVDAGRLYGRGALDTKGGLAAFMLAAVTAQQAGSRVVFTAVVDEEHLSLGTQALIESGVHAAGAMVAEPTDMQLSVAHKGFVWARVVRQGIAAHGSRPSEGVDAIAHMGRVLARLEELQADLAHGAGHPSWATLQSMPR